MGVSLREVFTPLISYTLLFSRTRSYQQRSFSEVRPEFERLIEDQKSLVKRHDIAVQDYESASFAVFAWIDELVLKCVQESNKDLYDRWRRSPLQVEHFNTANAGEEFFEKLDRLTPAQREVVEIYHLCLSLGFRGRYYDEAQDYKLVELRRGLVARLPVSFPDLYEIEKKREPVTPGPYAVRPPPPRPRPKSRAPLWGGLMGLLVLAGVALYVFRPSAPSPPPPPPPPVPTPVSRTREAILADVEEALRHFECCKATVANYQSGVVSLEGRVESEEQRQKLLGEVKGVPEVTEVRDTFAIVPKPFCEVLDILGPFQAQSDKSGFGLRARLDRGCDAVYHRDENLVIDVVAQKLLRYVYVDYYVADRQAVAHLFPNPKQSENLVKDASTLTVGGPRGPAQWQIQPPFGTELVTVIASPQALFSENRLQPEPASTYIAELRRVLPNDPSNSDVAASYCFIKTQDR